MTDVTTREGRANNPHLSNVRHCISRASALVDENNLRGALYQLSMASNHLNVLLTTETFPNGEAQCDSIPAEDGDVQVS